MKIWSGFVLGVTVLTSACATVPNPLPNPTLAAASVAKPYLAIPPVAADLGLPPTAGSPEAAADLAAIMALQSGRTEARVAQAKADAELDPFLAFQPVLGPRFVASRHPVFKNLAARTMRDVGFAGRGPKSQYDRPRPPLVDEAVKPCVPVPEGGGHSFPSGHAALGRTLSLILAELIPAQGEALRQRGDAYADSRAVCAVHFPTDVAAGQRLGNAVFAALMADPAFRQDLERARQELRHLQGH